MLAVQPVKADAHEFAILYSTRITHIDKKWCDGILRFYDYNKKITVLNTDEIIIAVDYYASSTSAHILESVLVVGNAFKLPANELLVQILEKLRVVRPQGEEGEVDVNSQNKLKKSKNTFRDDQCLTKSTKRALDPYDSTLKEKKRCSKLVSIEPESPAFPGDEVVGATYDDLYMEPLRLCSGDEAVLKLDLYVDDIVSSYNPKGVAGMKHTRLKNSPASYTSSKVRNGRSGSNYEIPTTRIPPRSSDWFKHLEVNEIKRDDAAGEYQDNSKNASSLNDKLMPISSSYNKDPKNANVTGEVADQEKVEESDLQLFSDSTDEHGVESSPQKPPSKMGKSTDKQPAIPDQEFDWAAFSDSEDFDFD